MGDDIKVNFDKLFLFVPIFIPDAQTQIRFIDSNKNSFILSFDSWNTDGRAFDTQLEYQFDIGSAEIKNSPKYLTLTHQTSDRRGVPNKTINIAIFDNVNVGKYRVDIDGVRYPTDGVSIDYESNDYVDRL